MLQKLCCMQLNKAGIVIGWLGVVISSLRIVLLIYCSVAIFVSMAAANTFLLATSLVFLVLAVLDLIASGLLIASTKQLKTAGIVIGWIGVVISSLRIVQLLYSLIAIFYNSMAAAHTFLWVTSLVFSVLAVLDLIASGILIAGTKQERHSMVLLWLIDAVIRIIITNLFSVIWYIMLFSDNENGNDAHEKIFIFSTLVTLALEIYVFCGIYALYNQIKLSNSQIRSTTAQQPAYPNVEYKNNFNV